MKIDLKMFKHNRKFLTNIFTYSFYHLLYNHWLQTSPAFRPCSHRTTHRLIAFQHIKTPLTAILPTKTALTTLRDHFSRQAAAANRKKRSFHRTHNFSSAVANLRPKGNPRKNLVSNERGKKLKLARRVAKWSIFGYMTAHSRRTWNIDDCFQS